ncbi:hypothetical protein AJ79_01520 [Helicocarpus griseus UAMH5409]|uniref:Uncharacterized protein n=1 Tax=Helicocarpus griseus UAMH5409 TaxID=1447875 RepID=A0A2B7Y5W1_9EURO|nr:hypothetical protein AJ79_01520 [Helicocarpus griseus UAMH5409]
MSSCHQSVHNLPNSQVAKDMKAYRAEASKKINSSPFDIDMNDDGHVPKRSLENVEAIAASSPVLTTASAVAPVTFGASPIDPALHRSSPSQTRDLPIFTPGIQTEASSSSLPPSLRDVSDPSSTSTQSSNASLPTQNPSNGDSNSLNYSSSLPGLSALASVASAPTSHLRYVCPSLRAEDLPDKPVYRLYGAGVGPDRVAIESIQGNTLASRDYNFSQLHEMALFKMTWKQRLTSWDVHTTTAPTRRRTQPAATRMRATA